MGMKAKRRILSRNAEDRNYLVRASVHLKKSVRNCTVRRMGKNGVTAAARGSGGSARGFVGSGWRYRCFWGSSGVLPVGGANQKTGRNAILRPVHSEPPNVMGTLLRVRRSKKCFVPRSIHRRREELKTVIQKKTGMIGSRQWKIDWTADSKRWRMKHRTCSIRRWGGGTTSETLGGLHTNARRARFTALVGQEERQQGVNRAAPSTPHQTSFETRRQAKWTRCTPLQMDSHDVMWNRAGG